MTDRAVAERVGVSVGSVYQYRRNRGIPSHRESARAATGTSRAVRAPKSPPMPTAPSPAPQSTATPTAPPRAPTARTSIAWKVVFESGLERVAIADTIVDVADQVSTVRLGEAVRIEKLGRALLG